MSKQPDLKRLTKQWYKKLEKEGFVDIEQDETRLKRWDNLYFIIRHTNYESARAGYTGKRKFNADWFQSQQEYYQLAGAFLYEHKFTDDRERLVWELHSGGMPSSEIHKELKKRKQKPKTSRDGVYKIVERLATIMVDKCQPLKKI